MGADGKHDGGGRSARADEYLVASDDAGHESKAATKRSATEAGHIALSVERVRGQTCSSQVGDPQPRAAAARRVPTRLPRQTERLELATEVT